MSDRRKVAEVADFEAAERILVDLEGMEVAVLHIDGDYYAVRNLCPHQFGALADGEVTRRVGADVPEVGDRTDERFEGPRKVLHCPHHGWAFDLESGEHIGDPANAPSARTFDVDVEDGDIYLQPE